MSKRWTEEDIRRLQANKGFRIIDTNKSKPRPELSEFSLDIPKRGRPNMSDPNNIANPHKPNKFGAKKVVIDGITFDSTKEGRRYEELKLMQRAGDIRLLELQTEYTFVHDGHVIGKYTADFRYIDHNGHRVVEDVKSPATRKKTDYRLRKRMMKVFFGIEILET